MTHRIPPQQLQGSKKIPLNATLIQELEHISISFSFYNEKICELNDLKAGQLKKAFSQLKQIGKLVDPTQLKSILRHERINRSGEYLKLYKGIDDEIVIFEDNIGSSGRLFYFTIGSSLFVVALKSSHFETKKKRK